MDLPTNIVSKLTGKSDLEERIQELEKQIEVKDAERDAWVSAVEGLKIQLANALDEIKKLKNEPREEKVTEQRSDNDGKAQTTVPSDINVGDGRQKVRQTPPTVPNIAAPPQPQVRVGVGVFILQASPSDPTNPSFLIGKRKGSHGAGTFALPGGHLEFGESVEDCAMREVMEETGLSVMEPEFLTATNDIMTSEGKHYITIFVCCTRKDSMQEARVLEPEKCDGWKWAHWEDLKDWVKEGREMFLPLVNLVRQRSGVVPKVGEV